MENCIEMQFETVMYVTLLMCVYSTFDKNNRGLKKSWLVSIIFMGNLRWNSPLFYRKFVYVYQFYAWVCYDWFLMVQCTLIENPAKLFMIV